METSLIKIIIGYVLTWFIWHEIAAITVQTWNCSEHSCKKYNSAPYSNFLSILFYYPRFCITA